MDFEIYLPCKPDWICEPLSYFFGFLLVICIIAMIYFIRKENRRIKAHARLVRRRLKSRHRPGVRLRKK